MSAPALQRPIVHLRAGELRAADMRALRRDGAAFELDPAARAAVDRASDVVGALAERDEAGDGANTGLLVTEGHRDEIELRRVHKEEIWDPSYPAPPPIARRRSRIPIPERMDFEGKPILPLDEDAVRSGVQRLKKLGCALDGERTRFTREPQYSAAVGVLVAGPDHLGVRLLNAGLAPWDQLPGASLVIHYRWSRPGLASLTGQLQVALPGLRGGAGHDIAGPQYSDH